VAGTRRSHPLERRQRSVDRAQRVHVEQRAAGLGIVVPDMARDEDPGVVHPDVERACPLDRGRGRGAAGLGVAYVERRRERRRAELLGRRFRQFGVDVGQVDHQPARSERASDLET
jgi:hypothetical protein